MSDASALDRVWTVPNMLSAARLGLAIVLFFAIEQEWYRAALALFLVAASTDWVDGWWARRFNQVSRLGRIFDPLVDKVIICGAYVLLAAGVETSIAAWMAVVVVVRELVVTAVRAEMERAGYDFSAALSGKLKMVLQCAAVALELAARAWPEWEPAAIVPILGSLRQLATVVSWAAVIATVWSGLEYLVAARGLPKGSRPAA
ncbi:MAG: CDP-diacylglycerol--glycerol-3-phosphate 3-phosphatidyltransferase [Planctomycetota bacterium]|nr:CDP-diacylglycerol--glycerol-3-phosphate 3-phosphatidyltransferase [Planctomycetota bacterium]